jgi:predicted signal transduction protein with EAL and GGDEF domain
VLQKASAIRARVNQTIYGADQGIAVGPQARFGTAPFPQHATDSKGSVAGADHALLAIKKASKDTAGQIENRYRFQLWRIMQNDLAFPSIGRAQITSNRLNTKGALNEDSCGV